MTKPKRNTVFVALHGTIGNDLVFSHYTGKVVVARYPVSDKVIISEKEGRADQSQDADYTGFVLRNPGLKAIYEKHLRKRSGI